MPGIIQFNQTESASQPVTTWPEDEEANPTKRELPKIRLPGSGHQIKKFDEELGQHLAKCGIYSRKGAAFSLDCDGQKLQPVEREWFRSWVEDYVWLFKTIRVGEFEYDRENSMSKDIASAVLASPQFLACLPVVERFHPCSMPWLRESGKIELLPEGLDEPSNTFTGESVFDASHVKPLEVCREDLEDLLREFPFPEDGGRSKSAAISAMLTVFAGGIMPPGALKPVFIYEANAEGSGKTTLAQLAGITYSQLPVQSAPSVEEEWDKRFLTLVISGRRVALFDNVKGHLNSESLERYTTAQEYSGRILGGSREFVGEAGATILITGNGLTVTPDLRRRSLFIKLFMHELRAEDRSFQRRLTPVTIPGLRPKILSALWGMVKAWDDAGRPPSTKTSSSFPEWCDTIAGIVEYAGFACPLTPPDADGTGDTDTADITALVAAMEPHRRYSFSELVDFAEQEGLFERVIERDPAGNLSRKSKATLPRIWGRFDRRQVTPEHVFRVEGKGHSRRYFVSAH
jgi:hypothetical protein